MIEIKLEKRYPHSRTEDITDAFMRGYQQGKDDEHRWWSNHCANCKDAEQTEPNCSEKPNNCEPKICDTCRYYNSYIPCGSTPSACKKADKFAEEFIDGLKKLKPKDEPQTDCLTCRYNSDEWDSPKCDGCSKVHSNYEQMTDCAWK